MTDSDNNQAPVDINAAPQRIDPEDEGLPRRLRTIIACLLMSLATVFFIVSLCINPAPANDLFWQLRTGQLTLQQGHPPHADTYSWTRAGTPWVVHEWLAFLLFWKAYSAGGFGGVWLLFAVTSAATWVVFYYLALRETQVVEGSDALGSPSPIFAFLLSALSALLTVPFFNPRPQMFTYLFAAVTLGAVMDFRRSARKTDVRMFLLVPMFCLWANLHAGVLIGIGILGTFAAGDAMGESLRRNRSQGSNLANGDSPMPIKGMAEQPAVKHPSRTKSGMTASGSTGNRAVLSEETRILALLTLACFAATLITPYSYHEYENFGATIGNTTAMNIVTEWAPANFHDPYSQVIEAYLLIIVCGIAFTRLRRDPTEIVIIVALVHEAITSVRNGPLLGIIATLLAARHVYSAFTWLCYSGRRPASDSLFGSEPPLLMTVGVAVAIAMVCGARIAGAAGQGAPGGATLVTRVALSTIAYRSYPVNACNFIEREGFPESMRLYNFYGYGGFLIWRMPDRKVFDDSRADIYFGRNLDQIGELASGPYNWRDILGEYGVDMIIMPVSESQSSSYLAAPDWALVYVDNPVLARYRSQGHTINNTFIFVKREPKYAALIAKCRRDCPTLASGMLQRQASDYLSLK